MVAVEIKTHFVVDLLADQIDQNWFAVAVAVVIVAVVAVVDADQNYLAVIPVVDYLHRLRTDTVD